MASLRDSLISSLTEDITRVVTQAVDAALASLIAGAGAPAKIKGKAKSKKSGPITFWVCDANAKRVPLFVQAKTGLKKKAAVVAKYGKGATFEAGKPFPPLKAVKTKKPAAKAAVKG